MMEEPVMMEGPVGTEGPVVVVGAGLMGVGIALIFARTGRTVRLVESDAACRATALGRLDTQLKLLVHEGLLTQAEARAAAQPRDASPSPPPSTRAFTPPLFSSSRQ
ncbi:MAG: 3-hydroxyacyl-CoA dehydrogenase NAD-binding domain-containing protein [Thermoleophilia bacterium]